MKIIFFILSIIILLMINLNSDGIAKIPIFSDRKYSDSTIERLKEMNLTNYMDNNLDSIFEVFVKPNIPDFVFDSSEIIEEDLLSDIYLFCTIIIDENRKVFSIRAIPLFKQCEEDPRNLYKSVIQSLDSVSKYWIVRKSFFEKNPYNYTNMSYEFQQSHKFILQLSLPYYDFNLPDYFYWMRLNYEGKSD